jgi:hypothetical protein
MMKENKEKEDLSLARLPMCTRLKADTIRD